MFRREESRHDMAFMAGVVVGAIGGALVTLALTPFSGQQAREKLRERTGDLHVKERAAEVASTARERVEPVREKATEVAAGVASTARERVEPVREKALEIAAKAPLPVGRHEPDAAAEVAETLESAAPQPEAADDIVAQ